MPCLLTIQLAFLSITPFLTELILCYVNYCMNALQFNQKLQNVRNMDKNATEPTFPRKVSRESGKC